MPIIDALQLNGNLQITADVCIVGAGAAGITLANELEGWGREVCLLEGGGYSPDEHTQSLYALENIGYPLRDNFMSRARYYGGTCNIWAGRSMILNESDLASRHWVPHSGWPLSYSELTNYYRKAATILKLPDFNWFDQETGRQLMTKDEDRLFRSGPFQPAIAMWAKYPLRFGQVFKPTLKKSKNVKLYLNTNVIKIHLNTYGNAVESVTAMTLKKTQLNFRAKAFVLACGGIENARLLLVSRDKHPTGVGNHFDMVGRFYMDHPRAVFGRVRLFQGTRLRMLNGFPISSGKIQFGIRLSDDLQQEAGLLNHHLTLESEASAYTKQQYQSLVQLTKIFLRKGSAKKRWNITPSDLRQFPSLIYFLTPKELMPHGMYRWYRILKDSLSFQARARSLVIVNFCEQPPNPASRVMLSDTMDRLGTNIVKLDWRIAPEVSQSIRQYHQILADYIGKHNFGAVEQEKMEDLSFSDASHHLGTTRMTDDPKKGVVDKNCKVYGVENIYMAGASVFPTAGHANPTLTIVALALRLADQLRKM